MSFLVRFVAFLVVLTVITACDDRVVATDSNTFETAAWSARDTVLFNLEPVDTLMNYNIYLHLRNNKEYAFKNLWLITKMKFPQGKIVTDTLQYEMADARGAFLGKGSDIVDNKLTFKKEFRFRESGTYLLSIQQAMRKSGNATPLEELDGVLDVGYTIEKELNDGNK